MLCCTPKLDPLLCQKDDDDGHELQTKVEEPEPIASQVVENEKAQDVEAGGNPAGADETAVENDLEKPQIY